MSRARTFPWLAVLLGLLACPTLARAQDDEDLPPEDEDDGLVTYEGAVRAGWRFLSGRGEGRFLQDVNLDDGFRIFDVDARLTDLRERADFDEIELHAHDLGERESDGSFALRRGSVLRIDGSYFRDLFSFEADGDSFPRDTTRERWSTRIRVTPDRNVTFRLDWTRSERRGEAFARQRTSIRELPAPGGVDSEIVSTVRPFDERFDTFTAGFDATSGPWRFGLTASYRDGHVDDERSYRIPPSRRGPDPVEEDFERSVRSAATTVVAKVGRSFLDDTIETTLFVSHTRLPVDSDIRSRARGFDNGFVEPDVKGAFSSTTEGENDIDRRATSWELDGSWQAHEDVEVLVDVGQEDLVDDAELDVIERRVYERDDVGVETRPVRRAGRTTNRIDRATVETLLQVHEDIRLRAGYEWFEQSTKAPFETQGSDFVGSLYSSKVERIIAGFDVDPMPGLSASALYRNARDDAPPSTPSFESSDEVMARVRWRASEKLSLSSAHRHRDLHHDEALDSVSRSDSTSVRATWSDGPLVVSGGAARQVLHTETDTRFVLLDGFVFREVADEITYDTRDVILDAFGSYALSPTLRAEAGGHYVDSSGDVDLEAWEAHATLAHDLSETTTIGLTGRIWRYDEKDHHADDYDAEALEVWLELRF